MKFVQVHNIGKLAGLLFNKVTGPKRLGNNTINMNGKAQFSRDNSQIVKFRNTFENDALHLF